MRAGLIGKAKKRGRILKRVGAKRCTTDFTADPTQPKSVQVPKDFVQSFSTWRGTQLCGSLELNFSARPEVWDGRFANNGWLQECPQANQQIHVG